MFLSFYPINFYRGKSDRVTVPMYPKHLVYPNGEEEEGPCLEMIRAMMDRYRVEEEDAHEDVMEMTEACPNNITLNIPLVSSIDGGKPIHKMKVNYNGVCVCVCE